MNNRRTMKIDMEMKRTFSRRSFVQGLSTILVLLHAPRWVVAAVEEYTWVPVPRSPSWDKTWPPPLKAPKVLGESDLVDMQGKIETFLKEPQVFRKNCDAEIAAFKQKVAAASKVAIKAEDIASSGRKLLVAESALLVLGCALSLLTITVTSTAATAVVLGAGALVGAVGLGFQLVFRVARKQPTKRDSAAHAAILTFSAGRVGFFAGAVDKVVGTLKPWQKLAGKTLGATTFVLDVIGLVESKAEQDKVDAAAARAAAALQELQDTLRTIQVDCESILALKTEAARESLRVLKLMISDLYPTRLP